MFCMHCGKPTEGDQIICPQCAAQQTAQQAAPAPVQEPAAPQQPVFEAPAAPQEPVFEQPVPQQPVFEQPAPQQPVWQEAPQQPAPQQPAQDTFVLNTPESAGKKKPKKKGNKLVTAIIALVTAAALVVGGIIGWPYISNWFNKTTSSPEEYSSNTLTTTLADKDGALISTYGYLRKLLSSNMDPTNAAAESTLRLQLNEDLLVSLLSSALDGSGIDAEDLAFLSDISVDLDYNAKDGGVEVALTPVLGNTKIVTLEVGMDMIESQLWFRLPELSKEYVVADFYDLDLEDMKDSYEELQDSLDELSGIVEILPEEEVIVKLLKKYIPLALAEIDDVSEKEVTLKAGGIEQKVTKTTSTIDYEALVKMGIACLKEVQKDKDIKAILNDVGLYMGAGENAADMVMEQIPEIIEGLEESLEYADEEEGAIDLITYVDSKGKVIGLSVEMNGTVFGDVYTVRKGDNFATVMVFPEGEIELTGEGTDKGGIVNATYVLDYQGIDLGKLTLADFDSNNMTKGTIRIQPSEELLDEVLGDAPSMVASLLQEMAVEISFNLGESTASLDFALISDGEDILRIGADSKKQKPSAVDAPSSGIDVNDDTAAMEWVMEWDFDTVLNNLRKGGVPGDLVDMIQTALDNALSQDQEDQMNSAVVEKGEMSFGTGTVIDG